MGARITFTRPDGKAAADYLAKAGRSSSAASQRPTGSGGGLGWSRVVSGGLGKPATFDFLGQPTSLIGCTDLCRGIG